MKNMFKEAQIIMLPHNNINTIITKYWNSGLLSLNNDILASHTNQHIYVISGDEIKEGDFIFNVLTSEIIKASNSNNGKNWRKIIATTDNSLKINIGEGLVTFLEVLPSLSLEFIEKYIGSYNKGEIIIDVLVEYEKGLNKPLHEALRDPSPLVFERLKINPKDNTITIKKLKDSWTRDEVIKKLRYFEHFSEGRSLTTKEFDDWIIENI